MNFATKAVICYYLIINVSLFFAMGYDKARAKKKAWRVQESTLFIISLLGGGIGGILSIFLFKHKTKKPQFYAIYLISIILHIAMIYFLYRTVL